MNSIAQPKMVAMSKDGEDAIWVWGEGEKATAVISPKKPVTRTGERLSPKLSRDYTICRSQ